MNGISVDSSLTRPDGPPSGSADLIQRIVRAADILRQHQSLDGSIPDPSADNRCAVADLAALIEAEWGRIPGLTPMLAEAVTGDLRRWLAGGLDRPPAFDATIDAFPSPAIGDPVFFLACMAATNGPEPTGRFLEVIAGYRRESKQLGAAASFCGGYRKAFDCIHLTQASTGFRKGNCIVLFPESVARSAPIERQAFALFFFNKFQRIYQNQTMPQLRRLFGPDDQLFPGTGPWLSGEMTAPDMYDARCLWGYLHDYAHHTGPRPLDQALSVKIGWHTGLLEELKCDLIGALIVAREQPVHWRETIEFIFWERMLRYPLSSRNHNTFDAGTGVVLFDDLWRAGAIRHDNGSHLTVNLDRVLHTAESLVAQIESLERLDDDAYKAAARTFVEARLGPPHPPDRYDRAATIHANVVCRSAYMQS